MVVVRTASGWVALIDTNGDGTLADETPLADYLVKGQTFTFSRRGPRTAGPITGAVNLATDAGGRPRLSLVLDTAGHGTHVAGIAAGTTSTASTASTASRRVPRSSRSRSPTTRSAGSRPPAR